MKNNRDNELLVENVGSIAKTESIIEQARLSIETSTFLKIV